MIPSLNPEQKKAVEHGVGPLLIVAGAGTGKTTVITKRIRYLIEQKKVTPSQILALTFTEKAAEEMLNRIDEAMPLGYEEPWLSTFHAFCDRILRLEALEIGLDPSYKILSSPEQWLLVRKHLFEFDLNYYRPLGNPTKFISAMLQLFSHAKDEAVDAEEFSSFVKKNDLEEKEKYQEIASAYKKYQELLIAENSMDFGDLILWVINLFKSRPSVLSKYKKQFQHILVDEFQDTNYAQYELIKLLAPKKDKPNLVVVGDDDQSIYRFRSASVSNILDFKKDYPDTKTIVLIKNYRSTQAILDSAYKMIQNNNPDRLEVKLKINKKLISENRTAEIPPKIIVSANAEEEADNVVKNILELSQKYSLKDFAVLARANNHLDPVIASLKRSEVPYSLIGNRGLFDTEETRQLIAYLKILVNKEDSASVYFLLISSLFGFTSEEITTILNESRKEKTSLWESLIKSNNPKSKNFIEIIENNKIHTLPVGLLLYDFIIKTNFVKRLLKEETVENSLKVKNVNLFFDKIKKFESESNNPTVFEFVDYLEMLQDAGENPAQAEIEDIDTVKLLTVHSAKGLEFPIVFIISLTSDRFPTRERGEPIPLPEKLIKESLPKGDAHLEEERRLFYVGLTRAKDLLFLSYAKNYGGVREKKLSGFVKELGIEISEEKTIQTNIFSISPQTTSKKPLVLKYLSYSQIETFQTCPLKYKYRYILGIPGSPSHALNFGQTLHRTLRDFHKYELLNKKPTIKNLLSLYDNHWIGEGFESKEHREMVFESGKRILKNYYQKFKETFGKPIFLEQKFTIRIGELFLIGSIDRIDETKDKKIEIIDYKTGSSEKKTKEINKDSQLTIYAIAASESLNINPNLLSLYFLETNEKISTTRNLTELDEKKQEILKVIDEIKNSDFKGRLGPWCSYCEFNRICPVYKIGQASF